MHQISCSKSKHLTPKVITGCYVITLHSAMARPLKADTLSPLRFLYCKLLVTVIYSKYLNACVLQSYNFFPRIQLGNYFCALLRLTEVLNCCAYIRSKMHKYCVNVFNSKQKHINCNVLTCVVMVLLKGNTALSHDVVCDPFKQCGVLLINSSVLLF